MKVGIVLSQTPQYSETFFISKIKGLLGSGIEVTLFVQNKSADFSLCRVVKAPKVFKKNLLAQGLNGVVVLGTLLLYPKRLLKFVRLERAVNRKWGQILKNLYTNAHILKANLNWVHFGFTTLALQSENVAKAINAKMAISFRGFDIDVYPLSHPNCYSLVWKRVDKVHSISRYLLEKSYTLGLPKTQSSQVITPAINLCSFNLVEKKQNKKIELLSVGRLHWIKGFIATIEAMAILKQQNIDFNYTIVGSGPEYQPLAYAIHELELSDDVALKGSISHNETIKYYEKADVYIQFSESEGFCNAVLEAQAMGCMCIVSNGGALPENIIDEKSGWVVPKRNPQVLAETIKKVIQMSDKKK